MSLESELNIFYVVSLLSIIDVSLTYFILWYDRKLNPKTPRFKELNPVAQFIMKKTNYGPWGLLIGASVSQLLIWTVPFWPPDPLTSVAIGNFFAGAIFVAVWIHTYSIRRLYNDHKIRKIMNILRG